MPSFVTLGEQMSATVSVQFESRERHHPYESLGDWFYFFMSFLIAAIVIYGFGRRAEGALFHPRHPKPVMVWIHTVVFSGWVLFYIVQSALVRARHIPLHRRLGWFGVVLGTSLPIVGTITTAVMRRFDLQYSDLRKIAPSLTIGLMDMVSFAIPFVLGIWWRSKPQRHRRLMLVATCALTAGAFVRFPAFFHPWPWYHLGVDLLIVLAMLRDFIVQRRIHPVYLWSLPLLLTVQVAAMSTVVHLWK